MLLKVYRRAVGLIFQPSDMPASKAREISLVCNHSARSALSDDPNNDPVFDQVEKKLFSSTFPHAPKPSNQRYSRKRFE